MTKNSVSHPLPSTYFLHGELYNQGENYVVENSLLSATSDTVHVKYLPVDSVSQTINYFDDLGRPVQTVVSQGSPLKHDVVQPRVYDSIGREATKYLPFTSGNDGSYKDDPVGTISGNYAASIQYAFYNNGPGDKIADDVRPFSQTVFEPSPLNRPSQQFGAGQNWKDNNKSVNYQYLVNQAGDVLLLTYNSNSGLLAIGSGTAAYYAAGQLAVTQSNDENGNAVLQYVDKLGHTICKKVQSGSGSNGVTYASTYYVYDDFGNLTLVLPPEAVRNITLK